MVFRVEGLSKRYASDGPPAVEDATIDFPTGAITSLLGPSGAGKSTVLRMMAGLELPDAGRIILDGADVTRVPVQKRGVGVVFQSYALFQHLTVFGNVAFGLEVRGRPKAEIKDRVTHLLELVQLESYAHRLPRELSGGQRQRVAFARALATHPKVLLLDEPFGALDARVRHDLRDWLERLHEETHVTTVMVTHDQDEAFEISQKVVLMFDGRVTQVGSPSDVYDHPATPQAAQFMGSNVLNARVEGGVAQAGGLSFDAPATSNEGDSFMASVRSSDLRLVRDATSGSSVTAAKLVRAKVVGARIKATLEFDDGTSLNMDVEREELAALGVKEGERVFVDVLRAKVFVEDYAI